MSAVTSTHYTEHQNLNNLNNMEPSDSLVSSASTDSTDLAISPTNGSRPVVQGVIPRARTTHRQAKGMPRVLFVTLEFIDPIFSGNGVYSRSIVAAIADILGFPCLVICARDAKEEYEYTRNKARRENFAEYKTGVEVMSFPVSKWNMLDRNSSWEEWCDRCERQAGDAIKEFRPTIVVGVDWTGMSAVRMMATSGALTLNRSEDDGGKLPLVYFPFRLFGSPYTEFSEEDKFFYAQREAESFSECDISFGCSSQDAQLLVETIRSFHPSAASSIGSIMQKSRYLNPPLRNEFLDLLMVNDRKEGGSLHDNHNEYVLCCCRMSIEKRVHFFVDLVCEENVKKQLKMCGLKICLLGARGGNDIYCDDLLKKLLHHHPDAVIKNFVSPAQLLEIFYKTRLNVHPALYDSYAMTIAETAACGVPTMLNSSKIGVVDVLSEDGVVRADMGNVGNASHVLVSVLSKWAQEAELARTAMPAAVPADGGDEEMKVVVGPEEMRMRELVMKRSRAWTTDAFAKTMFGEISSIIF